MPKIFMLFWSTQARNQAGGEATPAKFIAPWKIYCPPGKFIVPSWLRAWANLEKAYDQVPREGVQPVRGTGAHKSLGSP